MAVIPEDPKQRKALITIVLALGLLYAFYEYWYSPRVEENAIVSERVVRLEESNRNARLTAARGGANLEERLAMYQRHVMQLEQLIPASEEVPQLLRTITGEAGRLNVDLASYSPERTVPGQYYDQEGYSMRTIGEYHDIARFLTAIASLPRIISPVDLEVTRFTSGSTDLFQYEAPVVATFRIKTYVLPESGTPGAEVGAGGAP